MTEKVTRAGFFEVMGKVFGTMEEGKAYDITLEESKQKRSLDANRYMWLLCKKLGDKLGSTPEEIYIHHVRDCGVFAEVQIKEEAVDMLSRIWASRGLAWFCEKVDSSILRGYVIVRQYYGSSVYDSGQMTRLVNSIVEECKAQGIETVPPEELESLLKNWRCER